PTTQTQETNSVKTESNDKLRYADPAVYWDHNTVDVSSGFRSEIDRNAGHIRRSADAAQRTLPLDLSLKVLEQPLRHLAFKRTGSDCVHRDALRSKLHRKHSRQMMDGRLARRVGVVLDAWNLYAVNRANVDHAARITGSRSL